MNNPAASPRLDIARLLRAAEGLTQWRSMALGFSSLLGGGLLFWSGTYLALSVGGAVGSLIGLVLGIAALLLVASGFSGAGVILMDRAKGLAPRSMMDALVFGLMCLPKFIGFGLVLVVVFLGLALAAALVYLICKIPGIGPVVLFVAHPVLVVVAGAVFTVVTWVAFPLFTPAVWDGRSFKEALSTVYAVARVRLLPVVVLLLALYVLSWIIMGLMVGAMAPGYMFMTGIATGILAGGGSFGLLDLMRGYSGLSGQVIALGMASMLLLGAGVTLMLQVFIMGLNLVYLSAVEGLDISKGQAQIEKHLEQVRQKARDAQDRARAAAERARASQQAMPVAAVETSAAGTLQPVHVALSCTACGSAISAADVFCGDCGHKLK